MNKTTDEALMNNIRALIQVSEASSLELQLSILYKVLFLYNCFLDGWDIQINDKCGKIQMKCNKNKLRGTHYMLSDDSFDTHRFITENC